MSVLCAGLAASLAILSACEQGPTEPEPLEIPDGPLPDEMVETLLEFTLPPVARPNMREVVEDEETWEEDVWKYEDEHSEFDGPPVDVPEVDFDHRIVILASMRTFAMTGPNIDIEKIVHEDGDYHVSLVKTLECGGLFAAVTPLIAVSVPRIDGDVHFHEREEGPGPCPDA